MMIYFCYWICRLIKFRIVSLEEDRSQMFYILLVLSFDFPAIAAVSTNTSKNYLEILILRYALYMCAFTFYILFYSPIMLIPIRIVKFLVSEQWFISICLLPSRKLMRIYIFHRVKKDFTKDFRKRCVSFICVFY